MMIRNREERNEKTNLSFRSSLDIGMGILYLIIPAYAFAMPALIEQYGKTSVYVIGGLFILYGFIRIGRGFFALQKILYRPSKKNSQRLRNEK